VLGVSGIAPKPRDHLLLECPLALEVIAHRGGDGGRLGVEVAALVQAGPMQRDQQGGVAGLREGAARSRRPQADVGGDRHLQERVRPTGVRVQRRRAIPVRHPQVVLLGAEAYLLMRPYRAEAGTSPRAGELPGDPGVRGLPDGDHSVALVPKHHRRQG
jgi:hypothetical protein